MPPCALFIGLDAGGSKTELLAHTTEAEAGALVLHGEAANLQRLGLATTTRVLCDLIQQAQAQRPSLEVGGICAGVAGAGRAEDQQQLAAAVRAELGRGYPPVGIVNDAEIAVEAAFEGASGMILIVGTGSMALARLEDGSLCRAGGWGYLLGDEGGGYQLGLHGLRAILAMHDGGPPTALRDRLAARYGLATPEDWIRAVYREQWPLQQVAPLVVDAAAEGDAEAQRILKEQTAALARQVGWLVGRCGPIAPRLALLGGLTREDHYRTTLLAALRHHLPGWALQKPLHRPVVGALRLACQQG